jgi:hypothetical protein
VLGVVSVISHVSSLRTRGRQAEVMKRTDTISNAKVSFAFLSCYTFLLGAAHVYVAQFCLHQHSKEPVNSLNLNHRLSSVWGLPLLILHASKIVDTLKGIDEG